MTTSNGHLEPGDLGAMARDGVQSPVRAVLAGRRGLRHRGGIVAVAAFALTVVAAGIGLGGRGTDPLPSGSASASTPASAANTSHPVLVLPDLTLEPRTELPGTGCFPVMPGDLPEFRLWSSAGTLDPIRGVPGPPNRDLGSTPTTGWPVPNPRAALPLDPSASVVLIADDRACIRSVDVEFLAASDVGGTPTPFTLGDSELGRPRTRVVLGRMPPGDWVVRAVAHYATGAAGGEEEAVMERFFRVFSGAAPQGSQLIAPAVPCGPLAAGAPAPRLYLVAGDDEPVLGAVASANPRDPVGATVTATFPALVELQVEGDACATSWDIRISDHATGGPMNAFAQENPGENPYLISQNRIPLTEIMLGRSRVTATVNFGRGRSAQATWELMLDGPLPPTAEVSGPDGSRATATPGCSVGWTLANGRSAYASCDEIVVPEGLEVLTVRRGEAVRLTLPGWRILSWSVGCGEQWPLDGSFRRPTHCNLGGGGDGTGGDGTGDAGPAIFLPFPGRHVISMWVTADRAGDHVGAQYFVEIDARP